MTPRGPNQRAAAAALAKFCASFPRLLAPAENSLVRRSLERPTERQAADLRRLAEQLRRDLAGRGA